MDKNKWGFEISSDGEIDVVGYSVKENIYNINMEKVMDKVYWQLMVSPNCNYVSEAGMEDIILKLRLGFTHGEVPIEDCDLFIGYGGTKYIYFPEKVKS